MDAGHLQSKQPRSVMSGSHGHTVHPKLEPRKDEPNATSSCGHSQPDQDRAQSEEAGIWGTG
jgi:hypothetical protein